MSHLNCALFYSLRILHNLPKINGLYVNVNKFIHLEPKFVVIRHPKNSDLNPM